VDATLFTRWLTLDIGKANRSRGGDSVTPFSPFFTKGASTRASKSILEFDKV
jgi:hypothetical protein